jgi:O-antigen/teichoic acid export membrane protein
MRGVQGAEVGSHSRAMRAIARGGAVNFLGAIVNAGLSLLLTMLVARSLSTAEAGAYFAITSTFLVLLGVSEFGSDVGLSRFIPLLTASERPSDAKRMVRIAGAVSVALAVALGSLALVGVWVVGEHGSLDWLSDSARWVPAMLAMLPLAALSSTLISAMRGHSRMVPVTVLGLVLRPSLQLGLSAALVAFGLAAAGPLALAFVLPFALILTPALLWYRSIAGGTAATVEPANRLPPRQVVQEYLTFSWPRAITRILQILVQRGDVVLVALLASPEAAAIYTVATRAIVLGQFFGAALHQILAPQLSGLLGRGADAAARDVVKSTTVLSVMVTWPVYLLCASMAPVVMDALGGSKYSSGATTLALMGFALCFATFSGAADTLLLMGGRSRLSLANYSLAFVVDLALLVALVPSYGSFGAAIAWTGALVTRNVLGVAQVRRLNGYWTMDRGSLVVGGLALAFFLVIPVVLGSWGMSFGAEAMAVVGAGVLGYLVTLWLVRAHLPLGLSRRRGASATPRDSGESGESDAADPASPGWSSRGARVERGAHTSWDPGA